MYNTHCILTNANSSKEAYTEILDSGLSDDYCLVFPLGAFNEDFTDVYGFDNKDVENFKKDKLDEALTKKYGFEINCFGDIKSIDTQGEWEEFGITDWSDAKSKKSKYIVVIEVKT